MCLALKSMLKKPDVWDEFKFKFDATEGTDGKFEYTGWDIEFAN